MPSNDPPMIIKTDTATEAMRIDPAGNVIISGNVGIGTADPGRLLTLEGRADLALRLRDTSIPSGAFWELQPTAFLQDHFGIVRYEGVAQESKSLVIAPDGHVGVGTSTPSAKLNIDPQGPGGIVIGNPNTGQGGFTSLLLDISAASGGYARLQAIKSSGTEWGDIELNPLGGNVSIAANGALNASNITASGSVNANTATIYNTGNQHAAYLASDCCAAWFTGEVYVNGPLVKAGGGFQIDNPLAPAEKFLNHSFVESPEMKNIYDGIAVLDVNGEAVVEMPAWFEPLNSDFRYQLTSIGAPGPNLFIAEVIANNHFKIAGGTPSLKVSWQVTGVRKDAWAKAHPLQVEEEKPSIERGHFLHPELHGASKEQSIAFVRHPGYVQPS